MSNNTTVPTVVPTTRDANPLTAIELEAIALLATVSACDVADALASLGIVASLFNVLPVNPIQLPTQGSIAGPIFTACFVDAHDPTHTQPTNQKPPMPPAELAPSGSIVVVQAPPTVGEHGLPPPSGVWGSLMSARASVRGVSGVVVIDGRVRDVAEHRIPVFAGRISATPTCSGPTAITTLGVRPFLRLATVNEPLVLHGVPGTVPNSQQQSRDGGSTATQLVIYPGDIAVADINGVVIVPRAALIAVSEVATRISREDAACMNAVLEGATLASAFQQHRTKR